MGVRVESSTRAKPKSAVCGQPARQCMFSGAIASVKGTCCRYAAQLPSTSLVVRLMASGKDDLAMTSSS